MLHTITGERIRHELELILAEERPEKILHWAEELGVLKEIYPALSGDNWIMEKFEQARLGNYPSLLAIYFSLLTSRFSPEEGGAFIERLKIPGAIARVIRDTLSLKASLKILETPNLPHSAIYRLLHDYSREAILACVLTSDSVLVRQNLELYLSKLRYVKPSLNGRALQQMGLSPGPRLGEILQVLEEARLDQKVKSKDEEEELVRHWLSQCNL
jgi:tRNA nucleotidyltransferase (CCA-adding enzyme)